MLRLVLFLLLVASSRCARILAVYPAPCYSHQQAFRPLTLELVRQGHQVTVITPFPAYDGNPPANLTEINIYSAIETIANRILDDEIKDAKDILSQQKISFKGAKDVMDLLFLELKDFINSGEKFDLILTEACVRLTMVFSHVFKAPLIQISSFGGTFDTFSIVGAPIHPLLYPLATREHFKNLSMVEKVMEAYKHYQFIKLYYDLESVEDEVARRHFGEDFPSIRELTKNVEMIFLNVHPIWDSNRPVPPNLIYLGGLHLQKEKQLAKELKSLLDISNGTIYMSFGSTVRSVVLSEEKINTFLRVLSKLPYTVLWKWDGHVDNVPNNVIVRKWFPQADLLRHTKLKLFITQGGLQSIDEAIDAGVPMVGIPIVWDQWYNVDKIVELEIGVMCNIRSVTEDEFETAIETVISDTRFRENIRRIRAVINDQPQTSLDRAVWWVEHVIRHKGAKYLKSPAFDMSSTDYFEVYLLLSVVLIVLILVSMFVAYVKYCLSSSGKYKLE
ncbi:unnamed protein product [Leptosia nina]|uniref:UDP-glucuronosyltransferase n=1 Tax=Leptosia nina TaxID=320188 RepID=A0AAV1JMS9_9NEOP